MVFVAKGGEEVRVPSTALMEASNVWREFCSHEASDGASARSYEDASLHEIEAFVGVLTLFSARPTMPWLGKGRYPGGRLGDIPMRVLQTLEGALCALLIIELMSCHRAKSIQPNLILAARARSSDTQIRLRRATAAHQSSSERALLCLSSS